ncbi:pimeloyl-ACP methyl ester carboxylesterase [Sphingopyxis panaciterrae]|uniref:alpha/beta fold hydrolase n=1 Tax=Sphingopyxis panaciterrae TaxID=363841 RepID=UPI0014214057|nr:alpha/beta hydrolase [Sphingopyxis panaciterrae]NIJ35967.1 pimeloyl-ACP methyl ester carboxylesterase [Sphingopyxis panaciterrae]
MASGLQRTVYNAPDGVRLVADRGGDPGAPAVILLHGGGQTRHSWSRAVDRLLAEGFQVVNFDARGHGESDWSPAGAYGLDDRAADLTAVTESLTVPFVLVGASLGGATSIVAIDRGLRPAGLVLVDIVPEPDARGVDRIVSFMRGNPDGFATVDEAVSAVAVYNPARERPADSRGLMKNLREGADGRFRWHWDPRIVDAPPEALHPVVRQAAERFAALPDLPVLLVRGLASDVVGDAGIAAFRKQVSRLELLDVAGAGHMVAGDRNDAFNDGVIAFARRVLRAASR